MTAGGTTGRRRVTDVIDLHTHSTMSDGTDSPSELVEAAAQAGLGTVAITDHDSTLGWSEAQQAAERLGIALVRGAELSTRHAGASVHLLAYLFDDTDTALRTEMALTREDRVPRLRRIVERFREDGFTLTWADVEEQMEEHTTAGRPHVADALVARGYADHRNEVFRRWLHSGSAYYVRHHAASTTEAIRLVLAAGGVPVIAHPFAATRGSMVTADDIRELAAAGLVGIEVDHRDHEPEKRRLAASLAAELDLVPTGSSDYHGAGKLNRLGENSTDPESLQRIEDLARGVPVLR